MSGKTVLQVVMLGCGAICEFHTAALRVNKDRFKLVGVADLNLEKARAVAEEFGAVSGSDGLKMISELRPDITLIALPHLLHLEYGLAALENGSHLFLEKPMAVNSDHCRQLMKKAAECGKKIMVGHTHSFRPHFRRAARMIREGVIGKVEMIMDDAAVFYNFPQRPKWFLDPETAGGGALFNLVPHMIDHLVYLHDSPLIEVSGKVSALYPGVKVDSECSAFFRYADGAAALLTASIGNKLIDPGRIQCRVMGSKGSLLMNAFAPEIIRCYEDQREIIDCSADPLPVNLEWEEFYDHIVAGKSLHADGNYGAHIVKILEALRTSSDRGRMVRL